jgi:integration host factor subunit alpha
MKTVTRADLAGVAHSVRTFWRVNRQEAEDLVDAILKQITDALVAGEVVKVSNFASFTLRNKGPRPGRNPRRPDQVITIQPRRVVVFRPSAELRDKVNTRKS